MSPRAWVPLALALVAAWPRAAGAWCPTTTVRVSTPGECAMSGQPLGWNALCVGFSLAVAGSPDVALDDVRTEAMAAAARWHAASCGDGTPWFTMQEVADTVTPTGYNAYGANANTVSFNATWQTDDVHHDGTIAITIVTYDSSSGQILDADLEMNEQSAVNPDGFHFTTGTPDPSSADLPTILTHEFGHFQGLAHTADDTAVMWWEAGLGEQRRELLPDDIQGICTTYPPSDPLTGVTCNPTPYGGFALTPTGAVSTGGCAVARAPGSHGAARAAATGAAMLAALGLCARRRRRQR